MGWNGPVPGRPITRRGPGGMDPAGAPGNPIVGAAGYSPQPLLMSSTSAFTASCSSSPSAEMTMAVPQERPWVMRASMLLALTPSPSSPAFLTVTLDLKPEAVLQNRDAGRACRPVALTMVVS